MVAAHLPVLPRVRAADRDRRGLDPDRVFRLGIVIGVAEEVLWRGLYLRVFPDNVWADAVYPSIAFGIWHLCPLSVLPSRYPGGPLPFLAYSVILGFCYAIVARTSGSIRWCAVAHAIHDSLGLGAFAYAAWFK